VLTLKLNLRHLSAFGRNDSAQRRDLPFPEYSSAAIQKLEDDVVEEMVARRKSTAKALGFIK
jgi:hypothetical protein